MKFASAKKGRDGELLFVSRDLARCLPVDGLGTLQRALDEWEAVRSSLRERYEAFCASPDKGEPFDPSRCAAPLPRAFQWLDGSAYLNHVSLVRRARGASMPESFLRDPLMYQGGSDSFLGPQDDVWVQDEDWGVDFEAELAVVTDAVPMGCKVEQAKKHVVLIALVNDVSLRNLVPNELAKGFGFLQSKPSTAFGPVMITPDELGDAWREGKVHLPLLSSINGELFGEPQAGEGMNFNFFDLVAHAAKTRPLGPGTIIGSGTVSNGEGEGPGRPVKDGGLGYSCIAEQRMVETILAGSASSEFLKFGDRVRLEMLDRAGRSLFGAIAQTVRRYEA